MRFTIRMGIPEMEFYWQEMCQSEADGTIDKGELRTFKKMLKCFHFLSLNPRHPGLNSYEIDALSQVAGFKVWQSYLENHTPAAGRIYWAYERNLHSRFRAASGRQEKGRILKSKTFGFTAALKAGEARRSDYLYG